MKSKPDLHVRRVDPPSWIRTGYAMGFSLIGVGLLVLGLLGGQLAYNITRGYHRLTLPGDYTLMLRRGVYLAVVDRTRSAPERTPSFSVHVEEAKGGFVLPVTEGGGVVPMNGRLEPGLFRFEALDGGPHHVRVLLAQETDSPTPVPALLLSASLAGNRDALWVGGLVFFGLCGLGAALLWWTRRRAARFFKGAIPV
jgi:hypothetical protein